MDLYNSFQEFCQNNNLTTTQAIEILEKMLKGEGKHEGYND